MKIKAMQQFLLPKRLSVYEMKVYKLPSYTPLEQGGEPCNLWNYAAN